MKRAGLCFLSAFALILISVQTNQYALASDNVKTLSAEISVSNFAEALAAEMNDTTQDVLSRDETAKRMDELIKKYSTRRHKAAVIAREAAYSVVAYRGFAPSNEAANVLLSAQVKKVKSLPAAMYVKQKIEDKIHTQIVQRTLQLAMALDCQDSNRRESMIAGAYEKLKEITGEERAKASCAKLKALSEQLNVASNCYEQSSWDVDAFQDNLHSCIAVAEEKDATVKDIISRVKKYKRGKAAIALSSVVESACDMSVLAGPGMIFPVAAELANATFISSTGGCEPTKLVNQVYYAKSLESRRQRFEEETHMALNNYQTAMRNKSPMLLVTSEVILSRLVGPEHAAKILGQTVVANVTLKPVTALQDKQPNASP